MTRGTGETSAISAAAEYQYAGHHQTVDVANGDSQHIAAGLFTNVRTFSVPFQSASLT
jgi:hypothetical protein